MSFFAPQNPGIGGLNIFTVEEELRLVGIAALTDPNADRILFWDDSAGSYAYLTVGSGLSISGTTISATGGGSSTFLDLTDTPSSYASQALKVVRVNAGETGLEFVTLAGGGDMLASTYDPANGARQVAFNDELFSGDYNDLTNKPTIPTISDTAYDSTSWNGNTDGATKNAIRDKFVSVDSDISGKQATLVSGTNIKTVNGNSILGSGDLSVGTIDGSGVANEIAYWVDANTLGTLTNIYLNGSDIETIDNNFAVVNKADQTKKVKFASGSITTATTRTKTFQDTNGTLAELGNKLSDFASTTSAELAGVISDETGTGALVFADTPTFTTRINVPDIRASGSGGFLLEASNGTDIAQMGAGNTANVTWYGSHNFDALTANKVAVLGASKTLSSDTGSDLTVSSGAVSVVSASTTTAGKVELAIDSEVNTGTDATRAVTPDALAGSYAGTKNLDVYVFDAAYTLTTGDGKAYIRIPASMNGMNLVGVAACVNTTSSSGTPTIQIARGRQSSPTTAHSYVDMLSTRITIDANEYDSKDATTAAVINTSNDDVATGDLIRIDVDVTGTGTKGLLVSLEFRLP